ncbi:unnamed protein product, partial [Trichogramma brassicae]
MEWPRKNFLRREKPVFFYLPKALHVPNELEQTLELASSAKGAEERNSPSAGRVENLIPRGGSPTTFPLYTFRVLKYSESQCSAANIREICKCCAVCVKNKTRGQNKYGLMAHLGPAKAPLEIVSIDTIGGFGGSRSTKRYLHLLVDHFTRYAWITTSKTQNSKDFIKLSFTLAGRSRAVHTYFIGPNPWARSQDGPRALEYISKNIFMQMSLQTLRDTRKILSAPPIPSLQQRRDIQYREREREKSSARTTRDTPRAYFRCCATLAYAGVYTSLAVAKTHKPTNLAFCASLPVHWGRGTTTTARIRKMEPMSLGSPIGSPAQPANSPGPGSNFLPGFLLGDTNP